MMTDQGLTQTVRQLHQHVKYRLSHDHEADEKQKKACAIFADGLAAFRKQSWDEASEKFRETIKNSDGAGPERYYLKLCEQYKENPPEGAWDGVISLDEK